MPDYLRPLVTFLYFTGCRKGAALAITWSQIEFEKGRFQLRIEGNQTKNEEPILLPLQLELNEILKKLPRKGRVFDARNLRKSFQAACVKVGLEVKTGPKVWQYKGLLLHDFRRSGVRNLIRSGVPRRIAMNFGASDRVYLNGTTSWTRRICTSQWRRPRSTLMAVEEISSRIANKCFLFNKAEVAQLVEQPIRNRQVGGSSPPLGSNINWSGPETWVTQRT